MPTNKNSLVIVISQSGETADTLAALRLAKEKGITTLAIVNVVGSSIAREADKVFYTLAGPEISVATTKAYSAQLVAMYCLAVQFARVRNTITEEQYGNYITELLTIPDKIQKILQDKKDFNGLLRNMRMLMMCFLWAEELIMQFLWKAV